jgi:hypothetical protein
MTNRPITVAHATTTAFLALSAFAGLADAEPNGRHPGSDAHRNELEALAGTQSDAQIHAILDSCEPSSILVDVENSRVIAAIQLPAEPTSIADAMRTPSLALEPSCGIVRFGTNPFGVVNPLLGIYR